MKANNSGPLPLLGRLVTIPSQPRTLNDSPRMDPKANTTSLLFTVHCLSLTKDPKENTTTLLFMGCHLAPHIHINKQTFAFICIYRRLHLMFSECYTGVFR
jgi:hypothetical protein